MRRAEQRSMSWTCSPSNTEGEQCPPPRCERVRFLHIGLADGGRTHRTDHLRRSLNFRRLPIPPAPERINTVRLFRSGRNFRGITNACLTVASPLARGERNLDSPTVRFLEPTLSPLLSFKTRRHNVLSPAQNSSRERRPIKKTSLTCLSKPGAKMRRRETFLDSKSCHSARNFLHGQEEALADQRPLRSKAVR